MDGAVGVTQRAIQQSESQRYQFRIGDDESGTFWSVSLRIYYLSYADAKI